MSVRWVLAALHLIALGIGLGAVWARARALRSELDPAGIRRALAADAWWGFAAILWLATGLVRAFGGLEKGTEYYLSNHLFLTKMALFVLVVALEISPMVQLIQWRRALAGAGGVDRAAAGRMATISTIQAVLVLLIIVAATGMARGHGAPSGP